MNIRFLGSASSVPNVGNDCPCFLVNGKYLVDCGYSVLTALRNNNCDISKIEYIVFTHMHHDHYIGVAGLLFFMLQSKQKNIGELTILGPENMPEVMEKTYAFLQLDQFFSDAGRPRLVPLREGEVFETEDAIFKAGECYHPVDARCYRMESKIDNKVLAFTGDTAYKEDMAELFKNADAIIHDCTLGANDMQDDPKTRACGHSTLNEAIKMCERADIPIIFPMHMNDEDCILSINKLKDTTKIKLVYPDQSEDFILY